jgi:hypothetical protein
VQHAVGGQDQQLLAHDDGVQVAQPVRPAQRIDCQAVLLGDPLQALALSHRVVAHGRARGVALEPGQRALAGAVAKVELRGRAEGKGNDSESREEDGEVVSPAGGVELAQPPRRRAIRPHPSASGPEGVGA